MRKNKPIYVLGVLCTLRVLSLLSGAVCAQSTANVQPVPALCMQCLRVRVGLPRVVRGPAADIADNRFSEIQLPNGGYRGFDAHGDTRVIDGRYPWDMGSPERTVLSPGKPGTHYSCGQWIQHVEPASNVILGFVHDETTCRYQIGQTHKSMSLATSTDYGLTWKNLGQIITGTDAPAVGKNTGEGDCTTLNGFDSYYYLYCGRPRDGAVIVARAPVSSPGPGNWKKFFQGNWDQPGLGGDATSLGRGLGTSAARWTTSGETMLLGWVRGGIGLFFSANHTTFTPMPEPLLDLDPGIWKRPDPSEVYAYPVVLDAKTGGNQLSNSWMLVYAYWPPYEGADKKYLVFRDVTVSVSSKPVTPQVGVLLARWYDAALRDRWSTTAAVPGNYIAYTLEKESGYLMTVADAATPSVELEDCVSQRPGHPDHLLAEKGFCEANNYQRLRTAGWVYAKAQPGTIPLYRCYNSNDQSHFASNEPDCEKLGASERLLGYVLEQ
ncbi:hypothetical protein [Granulicella sibirica]|uniref:Uncharacterized protein n=1 Tax=Granulicella sibirica TaxID=2479048 RepID=A0A4Q0SSQ4_9BACT|nr:hypothetical protein [Granulicella sibirica]RXH53953.1 hypothetical protein GRAN_4922 [Granulicella sibirica]